MRNLLVSLAIATALYVLLGVVLGWGGYALLVAVPAMMLANFLLARRTSRRLEALFQEVSRALQQRHVDHAIKLLEEAKRTYRDQFFLGKALDAQIGTILYAHKREFAAARPYLERAPLKNWQARAMLAASYFKDKDYAAMERVFEQACKKNKRAGLLWATYAWCQYKRGLREQAIEILARALRHQPGDEKLKASLLALQNERRLRMRRYEPEWWAFHLEKVPQPRQEIRLRRGRRPGRGQRR
ncbi:MAG: hypothetical protein KatS3mg102_0293 [Planctomycetota bacterium]|nr:MAG: hypothetical protein KatS3mg102_0293 [Planctomycetota bacterium]